MKQREARRAAYGVVSNLIQELLDKKMTPPLLRPDGCEFEGQDQIKILEVLRELQDTFRGKVKVRYRRPNVRKI